MNNEVALPYWGFIVLVAVSSLWVLQHFLLPSVRWFFRRRANHLIDDINNKLALRLPQFKLTKREVLIDRLVYHERVIAIVDEIAQTKEIPREVLIRQVQGYAKEIVPAFNALIYFKGAYWLAKRLVHSLYRVRLGFSEDSALADLDENSSVVFVMNHRSNMDYILATYLAAERTALSYAVGEWARVWPLQQLIRSMGGYFVRRESGDPLYRRVLEVYVQMSADGGVPQAIFPEGKLSRDGALGKPKLGLLGYLVRGFDPNSHRDIVFVPVGINYDRVLEDRTLLRSHQKLAKRHVAYTFSKSLSFIGKNIWQAILGRRYRYGYACVNFGKPLSLKEWMQSQENQSNSHEQLDDAKPLADTLMNRIGEITPILPVALVATICKKYTNKPFSELEMKSEVFELLNRLEAAGYRAYIPRSDTDYAVYVGVRMFTLRNVLIEQDGIFTVNKQELPLLHYYANSIQHLIDSAFNENHAQPLARSGNDYPGTP